VVQVVVGMVVVVDGYAVDLVAAAVKENFHRAVRRLVCGARGSLNGFQSYLRSRLDPYGRIFVGNRGI